VIERKRENRSHHYCFNANVSLCCISRVITPSLLIIHRSNFSISFIHSCHSFSFSILLFYLSSLLIILTDHHSFSKLINHLHCDLSIILIIIHHQLFSPPPLYLFSMHLPTFTFFLSSSLLHTYNCSFFSPQRSSIMLFQKRHMTLNLLGFL